MGFKLQDWGVVVGHGETVKCNPGEFDFHISQIALQAGKGIEDVRIFVKVDDKEILLGTLSDDKYPHLTTDLIFHKEFELLHTSKTRSIFIIGYKYSKLKMCSRKNSKLRTKSGSSTEEDHESNEEVPLAIPLCPIADDDKSKDTESGSSKLDAPKPAAIQSSPLEEKKDPGKLQTNISGADDDDESDEDYVDSEEGESNDNEDSRCEDDSESSDEDNGENFPKHAKDKNRLAEMPLKTPPGKKAKMTPPSKGNNTSSSTGTKSGYVHVATPYPSKRELVKKRPSFHQENAPSTGDRPKQTAGYACESCSRTFNSYIALKTHCKVKKHKRGAYK